jgi:RHS repeat-associated protein
LDKINNGNQYQYDANGNATTDGRNGFRIFYNELNLPKSVSKPGGSTKDSVSYTYDATGAKLAVVNSDGTRYYHGSMVYDKDKKLELVLHDEGTIKVTTSGDTYQYFLKDHLGNTRTMFSKAVGANQPVALLQATDYYPFGKSFDNVNVPQNRYLYNGKEMQDQTIGGTPFGWYDYGARFYDPEIARWHSVDPSADEEEQEVWTPYCYVGNDPIKHNDPDGKILNNIVGGIVGGVVEIGTQMVANAISGEDVTNVNWKKVGVSAAEGFITSGSSTVLKVGAKIGAAIAQSAIDNSGKGVAALAKGTVVNLGIGAVAGGASKLAKGTAGKTLNSASNRIISSKNTIANSVRSATNLSSKAAKKVATRIQNVQKVVAKEVRQADQTIVKVAVAGTLTAITDDKRKK